jgi:hypothetical protein
MNGGDKSIKPPELKRQTQNMCGNLSQLKNSSKVQNKQELRKLFRAMRIRSESFIKRRMFAGR